MTRRVGMCLLRREEKRDRRRRQGNTGEEEEENYRLATRHLSANFFYPFTYIPLCCLFP